MVVKQEPKVVTLASPNQWIPVIMAIITSASTVLLAYIAYMQSQTKVAVEKVAVKAEEAAIVSIEVAKTVKDTTAERNQRFDSLEEKVDETKKTGEAVHNFTNSALGSQLLLTTMALEELASLKKTPASIEAARIARAAYDAHELGQQKQKAVDKERPDNAAKQSSKKGGSGP